MKDLNYWLDKLAHDYLLIAIAAVLFFGVKAVIGYLTYQHYNRQLKSLHKKIDLLLKKIVDGE